MREEYFMNFFSEAGGTALCVKALVTNSDDWSSIPRSPVVETENHLLKVVLQHNYVGIIHTYNYDTCASTYKINKCNFKKF